VNRPAIEFQIMGLVDIADSLLRTQLHRSIPYV
jgi:hypothetical protein